MTGTHQRDTHRWEEQPIGAAEWQRLEDLYGPLAQAVRDLIDAVVRTGAEEQSVRAATAAVRAVTAGLQPLRDGTRNTLRHSETGRPVLFTNPAVGRRNPIAPPMVVGVAGGGRHRSEFTLGAAYEGPPGLVHGGICALVLDQILGEAATNGLVEPRFTGTISLRYLRGTPLGPLVAEAWIDRVEGHKTYARGVILAADGPTVEAEGVFIMPAWARS